MPGVDSENAGETIQAVGKKGWRTYQPHRQRRKRKMGFLKCAPAVGPLPADPARVPPASAGAARLHRRNSHRHGRNMLARRRKKGRWQLCVT